MSSFLWACGPMVLKVIADRDLGLGLPHNIMFILLMLIYTCIIIIVRCKVVTPAGKAPIFTTKGFLLPMIPIVIYGMIALTTDFWPPPWGSLFDSFAAVYILALFFYGPALGSCNGTCNFPSLFDIVGWTTRKIKNMVGIPSFLATQPEASGFLIETPIN